MYLYEISTLHLTFSVIAFSFQMEINLYIKYINFNMNEIFEE